MDPKNSCVSPPDDTNGFWNINILCLFIYMILFFPKTKRTFSLSFLAESIFHFMILLVIASSVITEIVKVILSEEHKR